MIVSIHLPKSAGTTFRMALHNYFQDRLYQDYGDWVGDKSAEAMAHRASRLLYLKDKLPRLIQAHDCIHGHFYATKWLALLNGGRFFTIFRDPFEVIPSAYEYLCRNPQIPQPQVRHFHETKMTLRQYIIKTANPLNQLITPLKVADFAAIGIASDMKKTVEVFNTTFGTKLLLPSTPQNINPDGSNYDLKPPERQLIEQHHQADIHLWNQAKARFYKDT